MHDCPRVAILKVHVKRCHQMNKLSFTQEQVLEHLLLITSSFHKIPCWIISNPNRVSQEPRNLPILCIEVLSYKIFQAFHFHDKSCLVQVNPQFYAFRWITLLLTQEFPFPDSVRLWDSLLSDRVGRYDFLLRCCCAMLMIVRGELIKVS